MHHRQKTPESATVLRGNNILEEARQKTPPECFLEQLNDPLIFILFIAAAISMLLREFSDTAIILTVILVNAVIGVIQEGKAQKALEALKQMTSPKALIKQNGMPVEIPASDLIPGDIVLLDAGRQIPADLRLTEVNSLKVEESALTGNPSLWKKTCAVTTTPICQPMSPTAEAKGLLPPSAWTRKSAKSPG